MTLIAELKRRNVVRVGLAYLLVAWIILQVADVAFGVLQLPDWSLTLIAAVLAIGLVPALIFSWVFELTPDGLRRDDGQPSHHGRRRLDIVIAGMLAGVLGLLAWQQFAPAPETGVEAPRPTAATAPEIDAPETEAQAANDEEFGQRDTADSIAVLPFDDLSLDGGNQPFADGLSDTILHALAQIDDLRVIARNSSFVYKGRSVDVREVGAALDVAHVLEGTVQRQGEQIRVIAQLVVTADGSHVWSRTYTREARDLFALQDEIAADVATSLEVSFDPIDEDLTETDSLLAFNLVQLAKARIFEGEVQTALSRGEEPTELIAMTREAIDLDPDYLEAWATLADIYDQAAFQGPGLDNYQRNIERLRETVEAMEAFAPTHPLTLYSRASLEWRRWNSEAARDAARAALEKNPNMAGAWRELGLATSRLGDPARARLYFERAQELDPAHPFVYRMLANASESLLEFDTALAYRQEAVRRNPGILQFHEDLIDFKANDEGRVDLAIKYALEALEQFPDSGPLQRRIAVMLLLLGDPFAAERWLDRAEAGLAETSSLEWPRIFILITLGRKEEANRLINSLVERARGTDAGVWRYSEFSRVRICLSERDLACVDDIVRRLYPTLERPDMPVTDTGIGQLWAANAHMLLALVDHRHGRASDAQARCREVLETIEAWAPGGSSRGRNLIDANCHAIVGNEGAMLTSLQAYLDTDDEAWFHPFAGAPRLTDSVFFEPYRELPEFVDIANAFEARRNRQLEAALAMVEAFEAQSITRGEGILPP